MNRRLFIKSLIAAGTIAAMPDVAIDDFLAKTDAWSNDEFVTYIRYSMELYCKNPANMAVITGITL